MVRKRSGREMANRTPCHGLWRSLKQLGCLLWLCLVVVQWNSVEGHPGCSFSKEDWCGYSNVHDGIDGPRWHRQEAPAQVNPNSRRSTGTRMTLYGTHPMQWPPKGDHYLHTGPTHNNRFTEKNAELRSPIIQVNNTSTCLYFSYHNQVPVKLKPTLVVIKRNANLSGEIQENGGDGGEVVLGEFYSLNSERWFEAAVQLPEGEYNLIFSGKNYNNRTLTGGQVAITGIAIVDGDCGRAVPGWLEAPGDCGFEEELDLCGYQYTNDSNVRMMKILAESLSTQEQSQKSHRRPPVNHFMAMTAQFHEISNQGSKARLRSPEISIQREGCLLLWYYNSVQVKEESNNVFSIFKLERSNENLLFRLPIPKSNRDRWYQLNGALPRGDYRLILEVVYTGDFTESDYVGFDNIEIFNKSCSDVKSTSDVCDTQGPADEAVCGNGGTCVNTGKKHFQCSCGDGFYGTRCDHQYECSSSQCRNRGTCVPDGKVDFRCLCPVGYDGKRCEKIKTCESPEELFENARLVSPTNTTHGSIASFECIEGWFSLGLLVGTCNVHGTWDTGGKCIWVNCPQPPTISEMSLVYVTNTTFKGIAKYECPKGMTTRENGDFLTCKLSSRYQNYPKSMLKDTDTLPGEWVSHEYNQYLGCYNIPRCQPPPPFPNANVSVTTLMMLGVATYRCNEEYEMNRNRSSFEMNCSRDGRWIYHDPESGIWSDLLSVMNNGYGYYSDRLVQCFKTPDCGQPPKVPNSVVRYNDTTLNNTAIYICKGGYGVVGSEVAVCWKTKDNRLERWVDWLFVPVCEFVCPVREGRRGNLSVAVFNVSQCNLTGFEPVSTNLSCRLPVTYSARRKNYKQDQERKEEKVVFTGSDLCVSGRSTKVKRFEKVIVQEVTKCRSFCLQSVSEIRDMVVRDELVVSRPPNQNGNGNGLSNAFKTTRHQTILRYTVLLFN